ncbi:MAG: CotH kinase family protein [Gemmatimonadetes bacterium]|nr:CotH kinase family protein [Gemmatimonadota bacterium]
MTATTLLDVCVRRALLLLLPVAIACREDPAGPGSAATTPGADNPDWTTASHSNDASPSYATVFGGDVVNTLDITMTAAQWTTIRANMRSLWGFDFGSGGGGAPGGFPQTEPAYQAVTVRFNGKTWKHVGYRLKGNSSLSSAWRAGNYKLPFRLQFDEFEDSLPTVKNQRLYGFKEVSMSPGFADPSLIREKVTADLLRSAGVPAARTAFYRVFVDFGAGRKYCGVYTMVEVIDDTMIEDQFGEESGNIYKPESNFAAFNQLQFEKKNNEAAPTWSDVQAFITALNAPTRTSNPTSWRTSLEATFNMEHFVKWLAINNAMVNWDTYGAIAHNYYLYHHSTRKLTWIPWDHNQSMSGNPGVTGGVQGGQGPRLGLSLSMNEAGNNWPLARAVAQDSVYLGRYRTHMKAFVSTVFTEANMQTMFDRAHGLIAPYVVGAEGEQPGYTFTSAAQFAAALPALKAHVAARRALVNSWIP